MGTWTHLWMLLCSCFFASHSKFVFYILPAFSEHSITCIFINCKEFNNLIKYFSHNTILRNICKHVFIIILFAATHSFILNQSPGLAHVSAGGSVELRCIFEQNVNYCFNAALWEKLNLRTGKLTTVNTNHENNVRHGDKTCVLTLINLTEKDSGIYYCISHYNQMAMIGGGSRVIVTGRPKSGVNSHHTFSRIKVTKTNHILTCRSF